jgi:sugar-specific transcriptional regulator TrmB
MVWLVESEADKVLIELGLTQMQSKVYLETCKFDQASIKLISKSAQIARSEIYRAIAGLQKIGLVEKVLANPIEYRSVPLATSLPMLMLQKKQETHDLEQKIKKLSQLKGGKISSHIYFDEPQARLAIVKREAISARAHNAWQPVKKSVVIYDTATADNFRKSIVFNSDVYQEALDRGVYIRVITKKLNGTKRFEKALERLKRKSNFNIRYTSDETVMDFICFDNEELWLNTGLADGFSGILALWSNYPAIGKFFGNIFDKFWNELQPK